MSFFAQLLRLFGLGRKKKPIVILPDEPQIAIFTVKVNAPGAVVRIGTKEWTVRPDGTVVEEFVAGTVHQVSARAAGYLTSPAVPVEMTAGWMTPVMVTLVPVPVTGRLGEVSLAGSSFRDAGGTWDAFGTTLFWALWGERNDPDRLEKNLAWASKAGFDYIRILGMVGSASWADRVIDPKSPTYWATVDALFARLKRHGLRAQVTVFADAQAMMPDVSDRQRFAMAWAARAEREPERVILLETANEYWQNGIADEAELVKLTRLISSNTRVLVAASSPSRGSYPETTETQDKVDAVAEWMAIYDGGAADIITIHFDRDCSKADGYWRPVRQPWEMQFGAFNTGVKAFVNNEPIGPESSGTADDEPEHLALAALVTWLTRGAAYTLHTGAGIRGGGAADLSRGRSANLWEVPKIDATVAAVAKLRTLVPPMAGGSPKNGHWADAPLTISNLDAVCRAYQTVLPGNRFVAVVFGVKSSVTMTSKQPATLKAYRWNGEEVSPTAAFTESRIFVGTWS